jgi:predicted amidohydrolase YtcJ
MPGPASTEIMHMSQALRLVWLPLAWACALSVGVVVSGCAARVDPADLVLRNGKIVTVDPARPSAQALAVRGDTIVALGTDEEIGRYVGDRTQVIDLAGRLAIPGFNDAHLHFMGVGEQKLQLDLTKAKQWSPRRPGRHRRASRFAAAGGTRRNGTRCRSRTWKASR